MNDKADAAQSWKNPLFKENRGAERVSQNLQQGQKLRKKAIAGPALGTFLIELPTAGTLTSLSLAGFDFVVLDMEHSSIGFSCLETLIAAGHAVGLTILVRPWGNDSGLIGKVLDMGAHGVMVPHVDTAERAREIVDQARYAPHGNRGFSPLAKFDSLEKPLLELDQSTYVVVQIEGQKAMQRVNDIAAVPGVDAVFVGPYDLALSMGVSPGSAEVFKAAERLANMVPAETTLGIYIDDPERCGEWANRGFSLQCVGFDGRMLSDEACRMAQQARMSISKQTNWRENKTETVL